MVEYSIVFVESGHCVLLISEVQDILSYYCFQCASLDYTINCNRNLLKLYLYPVIRLNFNCIIVMETYVLVKNLTHLSN